VLIDRGSIRPVRLEVNFPGLVPTEKKEMVIKVEKEYAMEFTGRGIVVGGEARKTGGPDYIIKAEFSVDGGKAETCDLTTDSQWRRDPLFWVYELAPGKHRLAVKVLNPSGLAELVLRSAVIYGAEAVRK
jgi:hypothetical protein